MGAAVHHHVCTVEIPYHVPGEKVTDDILVISYHSQRDRSAVDALPIPCRGLERQPAANVSGILIEDPINQSEDNTLPILYYDLGDKSESDRSVDDGFAVPSGNPGHHSAGDAVSISYNDPEDQSAVETSVAPFNGPIHQAADDDHLIRSHTPGGQVAETIFVAPRHDSEDKPAEITSYHDPGHQPVDDTLLIPYHHLDEQTSEDKSADDGLKVSHQNRVDQPSAEALVISCYKLENPPASGGLPIWDSLSGKTPTDDGQLVLFHDPGPEAPEQALIISHPCSEAKPVEHVLTASGNNSGDKPNDDAFLVFDHDSEHGLENDALLAAKHDTENRSAENTFIASSHNSEHEPADEVLVSDRSEDKPAEDAFAVPDHELRGKGEDETVLARYNELENNHPSDAVVYSYASGHKQADDAFLTSNHDSGNKRTDDVLLASSHRPEFQPPDNALLISSHDSSDRPINESLLISTHDSGDQPAKDALLIISNALNDQPANDAHLILSNESSDQPADDLLVVSPYAHASHLLRLHTVSKPNQLLAKALTHMRAVRDDYATAAYIESFNWSTVVDTLKNLSRDEAYEWQPEVFYIVVFRSRVRPVTNRVDLGLMDAKAHEEAMESGGLLKYWFGVPDANCRNLATCVWRDQDDAKRGGRGEGHQRAMRAIVGLYTEWKLERLKFVIEPGEHGDLIWDISEW